VTLIGLYGDSRCGKDTVAATLKEYGFEQRALADPIRDILLKMDPIVFVNQYGSPILLSSALGIEKDWDFIKKRHPHVVDWMIALGQGVREHVSPDAWVQACLRKPYSRLVISDVRHPNEAVAVKQAGGEVWKITRPGTTPRGMDRLLDHFEFDATIDNNGTLSELAIKVDHQLWRLRVSEADQKAADQDRDQRG